MASGLIAKQHVDHLKLAISSKLRRHMTDAEAALWDNLRYRRCGMFRFRRQQVTFGFVADFYCEAATLVIEVDGSVHDNEENKKNDELREKVFKEHGILTIRFSNNDVEKNMSMVLLKIKQACEVRITATR